MVKVLPLAREWIEIPLLSPVNLQAKVLPLAREWIEIALIASISACTACSPSCEGVD